ncbi:MAG: hypothetical protein ACOYT4_02495 [Nanoarchaeota archaeon]
MFELSGKIKRSKNAVSKYYSKKGKSFCNYLYYQNMIAISWGSKDYDGENF